MGLLAGPSSKAKAMAEARTAHQLYSFLWGGLEKPVLLEEEGAEDPREDWWWFEPPPPPGVKVDC